MKRILSFIVPVLFLFFIFSPVSAKSEEILFFHSLDCPHCVEEEKFLEKMEKKYPDLRIKKYEISKSYKNIDILRKMAAELEISVSGVPVLIVGDRSVVGYQDEEITGVKIESLIINHLGVKNTSGPRVETSSRIRVPFLGERNVKDFSLPVLTVVIGILDGFNPCAMWVLIFLITLLLGMKNRKRMWILGGAFIFVSGFVYFLFLSAWLNLFLFLGLITAVRIVIGLVALGSGIYHIKEYYTNKDASCKVTKGDKQQKIFTRLREIVASNNFFVALIGIMLLAAAVNLVELVCSAGFPAVYTHVLVLSDLPIWQHYSYLVGYIFFFMLDDLFIFFIAMTTLKMAFINAKYTRYSNIIGGILMLVIGILLIFRPDWIMFG